MCVCTLLYSFGTGVGVSRNVNDGPEQFTVLDRQGGAVAARLTKPNISHDCKIFRGYPEDKFRRQDQQALK